MTTPQDLGDDEHSPSSPDSVAAGVLAAQGQARDELSRRRRFLVGGAVLGLLIALAVLAGMTIQQQRANSAAELEADRAEARSELARDVVDRAEAYEGVAMQAQQDGNRLRSTLEELLTETETPDDLLRTGVGRLADALRDDGVRLAELTQREVPTPSDLVEPATAIAVLTELQTLRAEAGALAEELPAAADAAEDWADAVLAVNQAVATHVEQVEAEEPTSSPDGLVALWEAERPALQDLEQAAATAAQQEEGLRSWGAAHRQYAQDLLAWIDEAVGLLEDGDLGTYNQRFDELFDTEDPFGFNAAVASATDDALASPTLLQLATVDERTSLVLDAVTSTEVTAGEQLSD